MAEEFPESEKEISFTGSLIRGLNELENTSVEAKIDYIQKSIISRMNDREGRDGNLSEEEIDKKLENPPCSDKPGEMAELCREITDYNRSGFDKAVFVALELADVTYYSLQCKEVFKEYSDFMYLYMGDWNLPCLFCILKYETRLRYGDRRNYKEIEETVMTKYLQKVKRNNPEMDWFFTEAVSVE